MMASDTDTDKPGVRFSLQMHERDNSQTTSGISLVLNEDTSS